MSPSVGRFYGMDPFEGVLRDPVTLHRFSYANVNPVVYTDPNGRFAGAGLAIAGAIIIALPIFVSASPGPSFGGALQAAKFVDIVVNLPENRDNIGNMKVKVDGGRVRREYPAKGSGTRNANDPRDISPTTRNWWEYGGDTPTGAYGGGEYRTTNTDLYGPNGRITFTRTISPTDHAWQAYHLWDRDGIAVHGGSDLQHPAYPFEPTYGCVRITDNDMHELAAYAGTAKRITMTVIGAQKDAPYWPGDWGYWV